ncbi:hypothetical protein AB0L00_02425 [Actinoallomurus sp. NPDC052308]|uniref:hypothetical protein n=1 Tax=Actinoallomurus sp. NPDC052308 TaxID=3155530 RepID=UPI00342098CC
MPDSFLRPIVKAPTSDEAKKQVAKELTDAGVRFTNLEATEKGDGYHSVSGKYVG